MLATSRFIPDDERSAEKAIVFAFGKAHDSGHTSTVYGLKLREHEGKLHVEGNPFRLLDIGEYIWRNERIREKDIEEGSIVTVGEFDCYLSNTGKKMEFKTFLSQLRFGPGKLHGIAHRGIQDAFPDAEIASKGISLDTKPSIPYALISLYAGVTADGRLHAITGSGEAINLNNRSCGDYKQSGVKQVSLPVEDPSPDDEVGDLILVAFGSLTFQCKYQAVCEGILLKSSSNWRKEEPDELSDNYPMRRNPRGVCLIINNLCFGNKNEDRYGGEYDEKIVVELFGEELGFEVYVKNDLRSHQMLEAVEEIASIDHDNYDAFFCFVMSHGGDRDTIMGVKGRKVGTEELMAEFTSKQCPSLANKPKVLIIQACRGELEDESMPSIGDVTDGAVAGFSKDSTLCRSVCPQEGDFLLAFSTVPGYVSYREPGFGTHFIQTLVEVIRQYRKKEHLADMLTRVTRLVAERGGQMPAPVSTLRYKLYL